MVPDELIHKYDWVDDPKLEAWTVAVVDRCTVEEVLGIYGGDPTKPAGEFTFYGIHEHRGPQIDHLDFFVHIFPHRDHVVVLENNGWSGSFPEVARRCSADGRQFFSVYWNVNAYGRVTQAIDGVIKSNFEPLWPFLPEPGDRWERRPHWAIGPETDVKVVWQTCMAQLEQQTGVEVDPAWLTTPLPTYQIPDPHWFYRDVPGADKP